MALIQNKIILITTTGASTFVVPSDFYSLISVEVIGGGAGGRRASATTNTGPGGGGGAYAAITQAGITAGASISVSVGAGGAAVTAGGDTYFGLGQGTGSAASSGLTTITITGITGGFYVGSIITAGTGLTAGTKILSISGSTYTIDTPTTGAVSGTITAYLVYAQGGQIGTTSNLSGNGGAGGSATAPTYGTIKFAGGTGGDSVVTSSFQDGGGGGGAAGPTGAGWAGGASSPGSSLDDGGGGGGAGGGSGSAGAAGSSSTAGGNGGNGPLGTGGGVNTTGTGVAGAAGTGGGGGGGHSTTTGAGAAGATYYQWYGSVYPNVSGIPGATPAGPGGGGGGSSNTNGGSGAVYGGGGGGAFGASATSQGAQGILVFTYQTAQSGYQMADAILGTKDLDDEFLTDASLLDQFVGDQLWGAGENTFGDLAQNNSTAGYSTLVQIGTLTGWKQVVANAQGALAVKTDGTAWAWGQNLYGQLGINGGGLYYSSPVQIGTLTNWKSLGSSVDNAGGVKTDGTLWTWGATNNGQLGINIVSNPVNYSSPVQVGALTNWKLVTFGWDWQMALKIDGTLWSCGYNGHGELGLGMAGTTYYSSPVQVGTLSNWKQISGGGNHAAAVKTDGTLWAWGWGAQGELGQGNTVSYSSPVQVGALTNWRQVSCGYNFTMAVKTDGTLWAWGQNNFGNLGIGNSTYYSSPVQVGALTNWKSVAQIVYYTSAAAKTDGTIWTWGQNVYGQLGNGVSGTTAANGGYYSSPVQVGALTNWKSITMGQREMFGITFADIT